MLSLIQNFLPLTSDEYIIYAVLGLTYPVPYVVRRVKKPDFSISWLKEQLYLGYKEYWMSTSSEERIKNDFEKVFLSFNSFIVIPDNKPATNLAFLTDSNSRPHSGCLRFQTLEELEKWFAV
jgi:hypothetical protein